MPPIEQVFDLLAIEYVFVERAFDQYGSVYTVATPSRLSVAPPASHNVSQRANQPATTVPVVNPLAVSAREDYGTDASRRGTQHDPPHKRPASHPR